jgi:hypothetical protein
MNSLAHAVHDLVVGREAVVNDLTTQERAALAKMGAVLSRVPRDLARTLAAEGPQVQWWSPPSARPARDLARTLAAEGPQVQWWSPPSNRPTRDLARKLAAEGPQVQWWSPPSLTAKAR